MADAEDRHGWGSKPPPPPTPPRWWVQASSIASTILGGFVIVNEALAPAGAPERPVLLSIAFFLVTGGAAAAFLDRWRR